eukprot:3236639-Rhodomonas_salina.2
MRGHWLARRKPFCSPLLPLINKPDTGVRAYQSTCARAPVGTGVPRVFALVAGFFGPEAAAYPQVTLGTHLRLRTSSGNPLITHNASGNEKTVETSRGPGSQADTA